MVAIFAESGTEAIAAAAFVTGHGVRSFGYYMHQTLDGPAKKIIPRAVKPRADVQGRICDQRVDDSVEALIEARDRSSDESTGEWELAITDEVGALRDHDGVVVPLPSWAFPP